MIPKERTRPLLLVVAVGVGVRLLFLAAVDSRAVSIDLKAWSRVAWELDAGHNPYATTPFLNWPPLWMTVLWCLKKISLLSGLPFLRAVQLFLIAAEAGLWVATDRLMGALSVPNRRRLLLLGFAVNPICILLTCQHGNFDVLPAIAIVLFLLWMFRWLERGEPADWLLAAFFLGLGILAKTVPLILSPLALAGSRRLPRRVLALGAALAFLPSAIGVAVLWVLAPDATAAHVMGYRSLPGWFGWTGILRRLSGEDWVRAYARALPAIFLAAIAWTARAIRRSPAVSRRELLVGALLLLVAIPLFGSGYGPQYLFWFWPLLLCAAPGGSRTFRLAAGAFAGIAAVTYVFQYALVGYFGKFLMWTSLASAMSGAADFADRHMTITNGPLFLAYLALFAAGVRDLAGLRRDPAARGSV